MRKGTHEVRTRPAAVAGLFYPRDREALRSSLADCFARAVEPESPVTVAPKALIAPHAGFVYSGPIAASAYRALGEGARRIERVVLLGPSHFVPFEGLAVPRHDAFETPLGEVPVDEEARREVLRLPHVIAADEPHASEHSLEVHLPFLQTLLGEFTVLPLAAGDATARAVGAALECVWGDERTLVVVSSDLSHYLTYDAARDADAATTLAILDRSTDLDGEQACGCVGLNGILHVARERELEVRLIDLRNSGDTAADRTRVVGYGAFALYGQAG